MNYNTPKGQRLSDLTRSQAKGSANAWWINSWWSQSFATPNAERLNFSFQSQRNENKLVALAVGAKLQTPRWIVRSVRTQ